MEGSSGEAWQEGARHQRTWSTAARPQQEHTRTHGYRHTHPHTHTGAQCPSFTPCGGPVRPLPELAGVLPTSSALQGAIPARGRRAPRRPSPTPTAALRRRRGGKRPAPEGALRGPCAARPGPGLLSPATATGPLRWAPGARGRAGDEPSPTARRPEAARPCAGSGSRPAGSA